MVAFHKYTNFGGQYYEPLLDFFLQNMRKYADEYDKLYLIDSNWNINSEKLYGLNAEIVKVDSSLRYYDAYKAVLPQITEDVVLLMDNDMVVYREGVIDDSFDMLIQSAEYPQSIVSIYDTIGEKAYPQLNGKSKFCPYWFMANTEVLRKYTDVEWGSNMPEHETLGKLTEAMLADGVRPYEWEEDKSSTLFDGTKDGEKGKDLGYYHIRAGSTPAYLLATKKYGDRKTYDDYLKNQPKSEYLRQLAWYQYMLYSIGDFELKITDGILFFLIDAGVNKLEWHEYYKRFKEYHGL